MGGEFTREEVDKAIKELQDKQRFNSNDCPHCDPNHYKRDPWRESQCILNKPLSMYIPPEGIHLSCPAHVGGHHTFGSQTYYQTESFKQTWGDYTNIEFTQRYHNGTVTC